MAENTDLWWIVVPETTTNLVTNPSVENATTGYSAVGAAAIARSAIYQWRGNYSLRVTPSAALSDGAKYSLTLTAATWYTFSFDIKGVDGVSYNFDIYDSVAATILGAPVTFTSDGGWARYAVTAQTGANTAIQVRVYKYSNASVAAFYLDGFQVEAKQYATDYCDGDLDGCLWTAGKHTSTSSRQAQFSGAGRPVSLYDYGYQVGPVAGAGMSAVEITSLRPAVQDGAVFRKQAIRERTMQVDGVIDEPDLIDYHATRSAILRLLNPNRFATQQPVHIRYSGSGKMLDAAFYYQAGFEGNCLGCPNEVVQLRLLATDPYWREFLRIFTATNIANGIGTGASGTAGSAGENGGGGGNAALAATATLSIAGVNYIIQKDSEGNWSKAEDGLTITVPDLPDNNFSGCISMDLVGNVWIGGSFTSIGGNVAMKEIAYWTGADWVDVTNLAAAPTSMVMDMNTGYIYAGGGWGVSYWDGVNWTQITTTVVTIVDDMLIYNGYLYIVGTFTNLEGNANSDNIARYHIATTTWSALSTGANSRTSSIDIDPINNILYVGGMFTTIGGSAIDRVAKYNIGTATFSAVGSGADATVWATRYYNGKVYFGGEFTTVNGVAHNYIVEYDITLNSFNTIGTGTDDDVYDIVIYGDKLYLCGKFTTAGGLANTGYVAGYDFSSGFFAMGTGGAGGNIYQFLVAPNGYLYIVGNHTSVGGVANTARFARWNGYGWQTIAITSKDIIQSIDSKIYVGGGFSDTDSVADTDKISYWDTTLLTWNALGTGADDGVVYALAELANGDIVAGGNFTGMGGVAATQGMAVWDISGSVWTSIGDINGTVLATAIAPNGDLYIGGLFLDTNSVANTQNLAYYDISAATWKAVSAEPDGAVNTLKFDASGKLYIGGSFRHIGATDYDYVALYDPATDTFSALENGTNGYVNSIDITPNGCVYLTGTFTTAGTVTGVNYVAAWNGTQFQPLSTGLNNQGYVIKTDAAGLVYIGGAFTTAGGVTLPDKVAVWNGTNFKPIDVDLPGTAAVEAMLFAPTITVIGFDTSGTAVTAYVN